MASNYWIKLYHEILDDPKMGRLSDRLWRRTIEMFLLAGEMNEDGLLPSLGDMAWRLRANEEELGGELEYLCTLGILSDGGEYRVVNFAERQAAMSSSERSRRKRQRDWRMSGDESATNRSEDTDTDIDTEVDIEEETEAESVAALQKINFNKSEIPKYVAAHPPMQVQALVKKALALNKGAPWVRRGLDEGWEVEDAYYPSSYLEQKRIQKFREMEL